MPDYKYPRPALTTDVVVLAGRSESRFIALVRRGAEPFLGAWALPGGFVDESEPLEDAARRELQEETGLSLSEPFAQVGTFGDPGRDPRGWTVSTVFGVVLDREPPSLVPGDDAYEAEWHSLEALPTLAFDHALIVEAARTRLGV